MWWREMQGMMFWMALRDARYGADQRRRIHAMKQQQRQERRQRAAKTRALAKARRAALPLPVVTIYQWPQPVLWGLRWGFCVSALALVLVTATLGSSALAGACDLLMLGSCVAVTALALAYDRMGFVTLGGRIHWTHLSHGQRMAVAVLCCWLLGVYITLYLWFVARSDAPTTIKGA